MKQKLILFAVLFTTIAIPQSVKAYSFSAVAPSGQTLYYDIVSGGVSVTSQNTAYYNTYPTGVLIIPDSVEYNGNIYSVTSIGESAFSGCSGLTTPNTYW